MTKAEKKAQIDSIKKGIAIYKKDIEFWQSRKKEADAMIAHDKKMMREELAKIKQIQKL